MSVCTSISAPMALDWSGGPAEAKVRWEPAPLKSGACGRFAFVFVGERASCEGLQWSERVVKVLKLQGLAMPWGLLHFAFITAAIRFLVTSGNQILLRAENRLGILREICGFDLEFGRSVFAALCIQQDPSLDTLD